MKEKFLENKLAERKAQHAFRQLKLTEGCVDFCSNDYLGYARREWPVSGITHGSTGSRLLSGNSAKAVSLEQQLAAFHGSEASLLFNSGYDANLALLSAVAGRNDLIVYDQLSHASIRDGIRLGQARAFSFRHNDLADLEKKLETGAGENRFVVTESVFSMDGHLAPLHDIAAICERYQAHLIVDEAHALGILGEKGEGLSQSLGLASRCLARVYTFGKAAGAHGAVITGSALLKDFLVNFARPLIYSTALPPAALEAIGHAYASFPGSTAEREKLRQLIANFRATDLPFERLDSTTPIQGVIIPGNKEVKQVAGVLHDSGFDVRPILSPTVPQGSERLRIVLHAFNTTAELQGLVGLLSGLRKQAEHD
ncbi:aminotransferase class I/II-fold pyridoxal phosphate-dependent enzyme [Flavihumibacter petaseus]|uniref:8-amino-7-oxononanoate synthase n=1 Tax=Flavihumibacter petaseus NBRC 106054 TaxID=1220578 RepID=A0A0E9N3U9_9BACT|nr:8-amino-7-oxononanoate synthase [Flavihumibacter petaseus]GAO44489.1 8-amino-7-oxononanoate synthase [Flavihumibacter petaseus NBRC 106054]